MFLKRYQFRPGLWPSLITLAVLPLLISLGLWQLDRAGQKAAMQTEFQARYEQPPVLLNNSESLDSIEALRWRAVNLRGRYAAQSYLLDNQVRAGRAGYRLYTPLKLSGHKRAVLIERDWLALGANRSSVPEFATPSGEVSLSGRVVTLPSTGILLAEHRLEPLAADLYRVQRIQPAELAAHSSLSLLPYVVRLDSANHAADDQAAALGGFGRERHLGYAFQWFALAVTLLLIYVFVNLKRKP